jgi:hypothetical protein
MTVIAVLADPPREGLVLPELPATSPLSAAEATDLYAAMLTDVLVAVERSGGDLLVNYRSEESLPAAFSRADDGDGEGADADDSDVDAPPTAEAEVRAIAAEALSDVDEARFEVQVGSTPSARAGNTITHLLREEGVRTAAAVWPTAAFLTRSVIDSAAMKLRSAAAVLGPSIGGRTYYAGFAEPIDFEAAFATDPLETLTDRTLEAGDDVDFLPLQPTIQRGEDLLTAVPLLRARRAADRIVPPHTTALVEELGLRVESADGERTLVRD